MMNTLRAWLSSQAPGLVPSHLAVHFHNSAVPLQLPIATVAVQPTLVAEEGDTEHEPRFYRCMADILEVLRAADRPLTGLAIMAALSRADKEWSDRWVSEMLSRMVKDGALENPPNARPRGYRLPREESDA
jgi:hypothetical protein